MTINQRIFLAIKEQNKTQKALADYIDVAPNTVTSWNRGLSTPSIDKIADIADFLGVSLDYLIRGEETKSSFNDNKEEIKNPTSKKKSAKRVPEDNDAIPYSSNPRDVMKKIIIYHDLRENNKPNGQVVGQVPLQVNLQCPICHIESKPELIDFRLAEKGKPSCVGFFRCSHCNHTFSVLYKNVTRTDPYTFGYFGIKPLPSVDSCYTPYRSAVPELPKVFDKPEFDKFRQAYEDLCWAKDYQIDGLVGMAYRRALECLIKDFLISEGYQSEYGNIPKENLANLLQAMSNEIIEDCGRAANNLSNDYVHYEDNNPNVELTEIAELFDEVLEKIKDCIIHKKALKLFDPNHKELGKNKNLVIKNNPTEVLNKLAEENRDLFCEQRFLDSAKMYRAMNNKYREEVYAYIKGIIIGIGLNIQQILGRK